MTGLFRLIHAAIMSTAFHRCSLVSNVVRHAANDKADIIDSDTRRAKRDLTLLVTPACTDPT